MSQASTDDSLLEVEEAARYLRINAYTLRRLARENKIPAFKVGGSWRFRRTELDGWGVQRTTVPVAAPVSSVVTVRGVPRILVVDDEESTLNLVRRILERAGYRVRTALAGDDALRLMAEETPDLVFLDLFMAGMTGPELLGRIRAEWGFLPVVILTGQPDGDLMRQALPYSPALLVSKPATQQQILAAVRQSIGVSG